MRGKNHLGNCIKYPAYIFFFVFMIIVPLLAVGLWATKYELCWSDENNHLKPWLFTYASSGIFQIIHYYAFVSEIEFDESRKELTQLQETDDIN